MTRTCRSRPSLSELAGGALPVVVIGGGQAGLSMSWQLRQRGIDHVVLERDTVGYEWRERRWDSFCLVTPNWQCQLPGFRLLRCRPGRLHGEGRDRRLPRGYADSFDAPLYEGVAVTRLARGGVSAYALELPSGDGRSRSYADQVVLATGGYHVPNLPRMAEQLDPRITSMHSSAYKNGGPVTARRGARHRQRAVGRADRRGPASRRSRDPSRRRERSPGGPFLPRP